MDRPPKTKFLAILGGALLILSATASYGAGLGKLSVGSALGQPLSAEIELVSLLPGEFEALTARSASPEAYAEAKVDYSPILRQLNFTVERRPDGKPVLRITSFTPVNEPFVDVLVEMSWPAGRLVREYPILLDPPGFDSARVAPPVTRSSAPASPPAVVTATAPPPTIVSSSLPPTYVESRVIASDSYGPVKSGDTLNAIAKQFKPDSVSLEQMLVAIYRENESAFIGKNMNRLRTGQILRVPTEGEVLGIERADAQKVVRVQVADWKAYRDKVAGSASTVASAGSSASSGKIATAKPTLPAPETSGTDTLKIAKSDNTGGKAGGVGAKGGGLDQLNAMREEAIAKDNQIKEANSRVKDLEKQIADMRKLMELKGLAAPATAKPADAKAPDTKVADAKTATPAKPADAKTDAPKVDATKAAEVAKKDAPKAGDAPKVADAGKAPDTTKTAEAPKTAPPPVAPPKVAAKTPPPPEPNFLEDNMLAIGGGAGALAIGGLVAFIMRRKKAAASKAKAKVGGSSTGVSSIMPSDLKPNTVTGASKGGLVDTGNSSFLTDFDKTGPGAIDTDEVDPVAEAEVYIAYGRDTQAEEILKEAMTRDKGRHEIAMKLLEIYHARKSAPAFETVAKELKNSVGDKSPMWAKAAAMGSSIDPGNPLYGGAGEAFSKTAKMGAGAVGAAGVAAAATTASADVLPPDLDFDLGFTDTPSTAASPAIDLSAPATGQMAAPAMDFNLDVNSITGDATPAAAATLTTDAAPGGALDFDLAFNPGATVPVTAAAKAAAAAAPAAAPSFDFDLSSLSLDTPATPASSDASLELSDKTLAMKTTVPKAASSAEGSTAVATKLELAKAYVEIGDADGAKEILHEVAREGNATQQSEAKSILATL